MDKGEGEQQMLQKWKGDSGERGRDYGILQVVVNVRMQ